MFWNTIIDNLSISGPSQPWFPLMGTETKDSERSQPPNGRNIQLVYKAVLTHPTSSSCIFSAGACIYASPSSFFLHFQEMKTNHWICCQWLFKLCKNLYLTEVSKKTLYIIKENRWLLEDVQMIDQACRGNSSGKKIIKPPIHMLTLAKGHRWIFLLSRFHGIGALLEFIRFCIRDENSVTQDGTGPYTGKCDVRNRSSVTVGCLELQIIRRFIVFHWKGNKGCV